MLRTRAGLALTLATMLVVACGPAATTSSPAATQPPASGTAGPSPSGESPSPSSEVKEGGTFVVAIPGDINRTDPSLIDDANSSYVAQQVVETLVTLKPGTGGDIVPALAESWELADDAVTYTFTIRQGVKFHDGTDLDAAAVKANIDRWLNIPQSYIDLGYTYYIDTVIGRGDSSFIESVEAPDASTLVVKLRNPNSAFLIQLTLTPFGIQSPTAMEAGGASEPDFANNKYAVGGPPAMVGTGPFKFSEWVPNDHVTLEKNTDYWNAAAGGGPYLDTIQFRPIADTTATLNALQSASVDHAQTVAPSDVPIVQGDANLQYYDRGSACNVGHLAMQNETPPFDNLQIRQAVGYAVNRQAIVDAFFGDTGVVLENWVPPGTQFAVDQDVPDYDPDRARQLIAESGVTNLAFDFWYPSDVTRPYMPDPKAEFEAIQRDLEAVGFQPNPKTAPWRPDYLAAEARGDYPMWLIGWNCDWLGIDNFLYTAFFGYRGDPLGPNIEYGYRDDEMNAAMVAALAATDPATQQASWETAQRLIAEDLPTLPIVSGKTPAAAQAYVKGLIPSPTLLEIFTGVWLDK